MTMDHNAGRFSERLGQTNVRNALQVESIDMPLRNRLWSIIYLLLDQRSVEMTLSSRAEFYRSVYLDFFEEPLDRVPYWTGDVNNVMRAYFYQDEWWKPYDLLEFVVRNCKLTKTARSQVIATANSALERYLSAYRFIDERLVPIADESHVLAVEEALTTPLIGARAHLRKSLGLLADRTNPDPANSIKESVSAVEAVCGAIVGGKSTTLGAAIKKLDDAGVPVHPALAQAWLKLYGYTSNADGIRHASQVESDATLDDARYFLVSCSAFVSLLVAKAAQAGVELAS